MGRIAFVCLLSFTFMLASAEKLFSSEISIEVEPNPVLSSEIAQLKVSSSGGKPELSELPEIPGLKWLSRTPSVSSETRMVNFKTTSKVVCIYNFVVEKPGKYQIPPLKIKLKDKKVLSDACDFDVISRSVDLASPADGARDNAKDSLPLDELVYMKSQFLTSKKEVYVGEEIGLEIRLYTLSGLNCTPSWPQIRMDNVAFKDFSSINQENPRFSGYRTLNENIGGRQFTVFIFRTALRPLCAAELTGTADAKVILKIPRERGRQSIRDPFGDDFFSPFFSNYEEIPKELSAPVGPLTVNPLPPAPQDSIFLGLVGKWNLKPEISSKNLRSGEPVTLTLKITGEGSLDNLRTPEIKVSDFRDYPPELAKAESIGAGKVSTELRYVLIPLREGPCPINLAFSTFSSESGQYSTARFDEKFNVTKGESKHLEPAVFDTGAQKTETASKKKKIKPSELIGPKNGSGKYFSLPIWKNRLTLALSIFLAGLLVPLLSESFLFWRRKVNADPEMLRKMRAQGRRGKILSNLKKCDESKLHEIVRASVVPYLIDMTGLAPGTSATELASKLGDKELAKCIVEGEASSYMPGSMSPSDLRQRLCKALKRASFVFIFFAATCGLFAQENAKFAVPAESGKALAESDELSEYYAGNYAKAAELILKKMDDARPNPVLLYNLADCYYRMNEWPQALLCLEKAVRLAPRDSDIRENLNYLRRKMSLPEYCGIEHPLDMLVFLRDSVRPDEWILLSSIFFLLSGMLFCARRQFAGKSWMIVFFILLSISAVGAISALVQNEGSYSRTKAFLMKENAQIHSLPSENSQTCSFKLSPGEELSALEERNGWTKIRSGSAEGWVCSKDIGRLF